LLIHGPAYGGVEKDEKTSPLKRLRPVFDGLFGVLALACADAHAFGLKTHLWISDEFLRDAQTCLVTIPGASKRVPIDQEVCESIIENPQDFRSGVLGPDVYPDLATGQVTTHPGTPEGWQTNRWLMHVYSNAPSGRELVFAAGYLVHAASDVFAHTYVNAYVGEAFRLNLNPDVAVRHMVLERYIDYRLPNFDPMPGLLRVPTGYLRDKLLHDWDAAQNGVGAGSGGEHVASIAFLYGLVANLKEASDAVLEEEDKDALAAQSAALAAQSLLQTEAV
jgi:hypothetical protein